MLVVSIISIVVALLASSVTSQESGWQPGQVNATMCFWSNPRAAVIRDTLYIDGGYLWWLPGFGDGVNSSGPTQDGNPFGIVYNLNFSQPFNISSNFSTIFGKQYKGANNQQAGTSGPQYFDGFMFANNNDWLGYGGLLALTNSNSDPPSSTDILGYEVYSSDPTSKRLQAGFYSENLPTGMTRYVTYGGGVNIPDLNLGYYFGGLRAANFGPIFFAPSNETLNADALSNTLITVNMESQESEKWDNLTVPSTIPGRASPELVWIPVATSGVLIAIGGVILPEYDNLAMSDNATEKVESNITSSKFMETVAVYDIAQKAWYQQDTSGTTPPATAEGCTVVASASDGSSHNIYWYGGFNGVDATTPFFDDVYVLSVPSFTWTKIYSGTASHGRAGHRCSKPYPDQMFVLGGYPSAPGNGPPSCLEGGILQVFNLSSGTFIDSYNPTVWNEYAVPSAVTNVIGGSAEGGATLTTPSSSWADSDLATVFGSKYSGTPVTKWFPYALNTTRPGGGATAEPTSTIIVNHGGGLPSWVAPVLGVVLGLMAVTAIVVIFLLWRRRKFLQNHQSEEGTTDLNRHRIMSWVRGMPTDTTTKAATVTTEENPESNFSDPDTLASKNVMAVEAASNTVHEMMDTSQPQELSDTGLTYTGLTASASDASRVSGMSGMTYASRRIPRSSGTPRPESPSLGNTPPKRTKSGVSSLRSGHNHQVSEVGSVDSVSTEQTAVLRTPEVTQDPSFLSPVSPPSPRHGEAGDYMSASEPNKSSIEKDGRRSNFEENLDE